MARIWAARFESGCCWYRPSSGAPPWWQWRGWSQRLTLSSSSCFGWFPLKLCLSASLLRRGGSSPLGLLLGSRSHYLLLWMPLDFRRAGGNWIQFGIELINCRITWRWAGGNWIHSLWRDVIQCVSDGCRDLGLQKTATGLGSVCSSIFWFLSSLSVLVGIVKFSNDLIDMTLGWESVTLINAAASWDCASKVSRWDFSPKSVVPNNWL